MRGVPGRESEPLAHPELGMARRLDDFIFPDVPTTCGFMSACRPQGWSGAEDRQLYPEYASHACQRPLDGIGREEDPNAGPKNGVTWSCGGGAMETASSSGFCPELNANGTEGGLCRAMNDDWVYQMFKQQIMDPLNPTAQIGWNFEKGDCMKREDAEKTRHKDRKRAQARARAIL